jgi:2',3'-cyclic-nucleotide 2'-phosphodiesterase (5'-nucleotidase family)
MNGFKITTSNNQKIRFVLYTEAAPLTCKAFVEVLPFTRTFYHARVSGQEIWIDNVPKLNIIQENASVFTEPGEVVFGPSQPTRNKTANCFGIYYGEGKGLDACNIFARVLESDRQKLIDLGNSIWKKGSQELTVSVIENEAE